MINKSNIFLVMISLSLIFALLTIIFSYFNEEILDKIEQSDSSVDAQKKMSNDGRTDNQQLNDTGLDLEALYGGLHKEGAISIAEHIDLLDQGLLSDDELKKFYSIAILRKAVSSDRQSVSEYIKNSSVRKEAIYKLLNAEKFDIRISAFGLLVIVDISNPITIYELISALKREDEKKLEIVRELGMQKDNLNNELRSALVDEVLDFNVGDSQGGAVVEMILLLSKLKPSGVESSIFPYACELYERSFYESPVILESFEYFGRVHGNCRNSMKKVIVSLKDGSIHLKQPYHKNWLINRTNSVVAQLGK